MPKPNRDSDHDRAWVKPYLERARKDVALGKLIDGKTVIAALEAQAHGPERSITR